jgi:PilZ domain-containing protein
MQIDRRRSTRYNFGAIAEVIDLGPRSAIVCMTRDLSLSGCFVKTETHFAQGSEVIVRIRHSGSDFAAVGKVTGNMTPEGIGIEFVNVQPKYQTIIEGWLGYKTAASGEAGVPVLVSGDLETGPFTEETEGQMIAPNRALLSVSAPVSPGQVVRLKNRLTRAEQTCRVLFVGPSSEDKLRLLAVEFLEQAHNFWSR